MPLVAYENSDDSDSETETCEDIVPVSKSSVIAVDVTETDHKYITEKPDVEEIVHPKLVNTLPKPKNGDIPLFEDELTKRLLFSSMPNKSTLNKKLPEPIKCESFTKTNVNSGKKKPVKITLPSLSEFNDEEEPKPKKVKPSTKGSGLFSLLPAPKNLIVKENNRKLIPRVVSKGPTPSKPPPSIKKTSKKDLSSLISYNDSGEESGGEDPSEIDFFSLTKANSEDKSSIKEPLVSDIIDDSFLNPISKPRHEVETPQKLGGETDLSVLPTSSYQNPSDVLGPQPNEAPYADDEESELQLNDDAIQRLCGRRGRQEIAEMQIIDVCGATHLPDPKEWLTKQLTEEQETRSHSHRRRDGPTTQQRRKHQITYLAFQAKEHELELKNQWAQNKMSRKQTQAKYGF